MSTFHVTNIFYLRTPKTKTNRKFKWKASKVIRGCSFQNFARRKLKIVINSFWLLVRWLLQTNQQKCKSGFLFFKL
jgi:hypothetical protein